MDLGASCGSALATLLPCRPTVWRSCDLCHSYSDDFTADGKREEDFEQGFEGEDVDDLPNFVTDTQRESPTGPLDRLSPSSGALEHDTATPVTVAVAESKLGDDHLQPEPEVSKLASGSGLRAVRAAATSNFSSGGADDIAATPAPGPDPSTSPGAAARRRGGLRRVLKPEGDLASWMAQLGDMARHRIVVRKAWGSRSVTNPGPTRHPSLQPGLTSQPGTPFSNPLPMHTSPAPLGLGLQTNQTNQPSWAGSLGPRRWL